MLALHRRHMQCKLLLEMEAARSITRRKQATRQAAGLTSDEEAMGPCSCILSITTAAITAATSNELLPEAAAAATATCCKPPPLLAPPLAAAAGATRAINMVLR